MLRNEFRMTDYDIFKLREARRSFLRRGACCVGSLALAQLFDPKMFSSIAGAAPAGRFKITMTPGNRTYCSGAPDQNG